MSRNPTEQELDDAINDIIEDDKVDLAQEKYTVVKGNPKNKSRKSPVHMLIDRIGDKPGQYQTVAQVAEKFGVSDSTIRRLADRDDVKGPSHYMQMGDTRVALYTKSDIKSIERYLAKRRKVLPADDA